MNSHEDVKLHEEGQKSRGTTCEACTIENSASYFYIYTSSYQITGADHGS